MKLSLSIPASALLLAGLCGCSTPQRNVTPAATPPFMAETAVTARRTEQFNRITAGFKVRGIGIYPEAFEGRIPVNAVVERIERLKFNRVYCCITSEKSLDEDLTALLIALGEKGLPVEIVLQQKDFYRKNQVNQLIRPLTPDYPDLVKAVEKVLEYNAELPENVRKISGITVVVGPHFFNTGSVERCSGELFSWDENHYGIGGDNDMLMKETFDMLKKISALPGLPPLTVGIYDFYHEKAVAGEISCGKVSDFAGFGKVMVLNTGNVPTQLVKSVQDELAAAGNTPVLVTIRLAGHTSEKQGKLRRRDWNDFCSALDHAGKAYVKYPNFSGVVVSPLAIIEFLRQER